MVQASSGNTVRVHYSGFLEDGSIFDSSLEGDPLEFVLGTEEVIPGFERAVVGMVEGDTKTVVISPEDGYGLRDETMVAVVERSAIPPEIEVLVGAVLEIFSDDGDCAEVTITGVTDRTVTLDGNHPLAGKELIFELKLVEVKGAS